MQVYITESEYMYFKKGAKVIAYLKKPTFHTKEIFKKINIVKEEIVDNDSYENRIILCKKH